MLYDKITLPNGVRVVSQKIENIRSASLGIWVGAGSRHEPKIRGGYAHFIEHMVFKGTESRSASDIAELMDGIGGQVNAFTTKECTCFYARALDSHIPAALDILSDMFFCSRFSEEDVATERGVILEEIGMYEDSPDDLVTERLYSAIYDGSSLGRPVLGTPATLKGATGDLLKQYMRKSYRPEATVISLAGSFDDKVLGEIKERFSVMPSARAPKAARAEYIPSFTFKEKPTEQNHLCLAFPAGAYSDPDRFAMQILSGMLGGGMSSRLFQKVREEKGLCYSVYSFQSSHADTGVFGVYTALSSQTERTALELIRDVIRDFTENGVSRDELERAREQVKANVLMSLESTVSRMNSLARGELFLNQVLSPDEIIAAYDAVTMDDIRRLSRQTFDFDKISFSAVGKIGGEAMYHEILKQ